MPRIDGDLPGWGDWAGPGDGFAAPQVAADDDADAAAAFFQGPIDFDALDQLLVNNAVQQAAQRIFLPRGSVRGSCPQFCPKPKRTQ